MILPLRHAIVVGATLAAVACAPSRRSAPAPTTAALALLPGPKPAAAGTLRDEVSEYDSATGVLFVLEADGKLWLVDTARATGKRVPYRVGGVVIRRRSVGPQAGSNQLRVTPERATSTS